MQENLWSFDLWENLWPLVLIALGLLWIVRGPLWLGIVSVVAGGIFLADTFNIAIDMETYWPLLIVALGVGVLLERSGVSRGRAAPISGNAQTLTDDGSVVEVSATFGGANRVVTSQAFRGGTVSATFGGAEIDMRQAQLHENGADMQVLGDVRRRDAPCAANRGSSTRTARPCCPAWRTCAATTRQKGRRCGSERLRRSAA